ncbi:CDP-alcohol phosphatidyltransferase family protein [Thermoflexus sp.]|uniref:CDP-alcohol phosphatidyltransferase family protein n=1 Tax=Thermoflexus sp. TaxID=1969742 RepID=UPI0025F66DBD|nr:CDP-alcohol phosphatidyltransferase family protein [Thermoflexus sp.]MDW8065106.1 CDP-alcohol phosphatidyltransferase family protein [Anaerolineae bacterium]MCS6964848.1 CDP-alcohol phosphatidyltransferase family protein [Thermoflexus sp.]MCS7351095.1 CDP-alcohol phosphatidyltransferase family protein [Thermoflexus sp.]MCX7690509.1 CDP-alcohol phosphatidyltransferase family protein [Thermoflexus sp.]MDW8180548.1 CDP-alcohol phosphatidyltransferase family protein [Anaerolineae bacterium]
MNAERWRESAGPWLGRLARYLDRWGIHPNVITVLGFLLSLGAGGLAGLDLRWGAALLWMFGGLCDALDGALARVSGKASPAGAFLDSTLDRYSDAAVLLGMGAAWQRAGTAWGGWIAGIALLGALMVSYTRARGEGLGISLREGLFTRLERFLLVLIALLTGWYGPLLILFAILAHLTVLQRAWQAMRMLSSPERHPL